MYTLGSKTDSKDQESTQSSTPPVPDTKWESNKITINIAKKSKHVSPFPSGDHKAAMNRRESMINTNINNTNDPCKKYGLGMVSKNILLEGLNRFHDAQT